MLFWASAARGFWTAQTRERLAEGDRSTRSALESSGYTRTRALDSTVDRGYNCQNCGSNVPCITTVLSRLLQIHVKMIPVIIHASAVTVSTGKEVTIPSLSFQRSWLRTEQARVHAAFPMPLLWKGPKP